MIAITLHDHEVRRLLAQGSVLVVRPVKPQPPTHTTHAVVRSDQANMWIFHETFRQFVAQTNILCPYGAPGTEHWVRETWQLNSVVWDMGALPKHHPRDRITGELVELIYRADGEIDKQFEPEPDTGRWRWRSPVTMPRWASRYAVTVRDVRVLQVGDVTDNAVLEAGFDHAFVPFVDWWDSHKNYPPYADNPWAWAITVERTPDNPAEEDAR
jgi:hypothetical protein